MNVPESGIVRKAHAFLVKEGLCGKRVTALFTDAHHSLTAFKDLEPFQRVSIDYGEFVVHPDLVGSLGDARVLFAVEAKGSGDLVRGLGQAQCYQDAVHASFLCAPAAEIGKGIRSLARRGNVGLLAVSDSVQLVNEPEFRSPVYEAHEFVLRQIDSARLVTRAQTFAYNLPTHYLVWAAVLVPGRWYGPDEVPLILGAYPMPKDWRAALRGAQKLGLIETSAERFRLTEAGAAIKDMVPSEIRVWKSIHGALCDKAEKATLKFEAPALAAALRLLLLNDPMVKMIRVGIGSLPDQSGNFRDLAMACDRLDHARAVVFFFNPEALEMIVDERGQIIWERVEGKHFRSTMFYQFKSVLRHAGILAPLALGGCSATKYRPERDIWALHKH